MSQDMSEVTGFHSREHLFFRRGDDGSVTVEKWTPAPPFKLVARVTLDENTWASVVASVSCRGENTFTFRDALDMHTAPPEDDPAAGLIRGNVPTEDA